MKALHSVPFLLRQFNDRIGVSDLIRAREQLRANPTYQPQTRYVLDTGWLQDPVYGVETDTVQPRTMRARELYGPQAGDASDILRSLYRSAAQVYSRNDPTTRLALVVERWEWDLIRRHMSLVEFEGAFGREGTRPAIHGIPLEII